MARQIPVPGQGPLRIPPIFRGAAAVENSTYEPLHMDVIDIISSAELCYPLTPEEIESVFSAGDGNDEKGRPAAHMATILVANCLDQQRTPADIISFRRAATIEATLSMAAKNILPRSQRPNNAQKLLLLNELANRRLSADNYADILSEVVTMAGEFSTDYLRSRPGTTRRLGRLAQRSRKTNHPMMNALGATGERLFDGTLPDASRCQVYERATRLVGYIVDRAMRTVE